MLHAPRFVYSCVMLLGRAAQRLQKQLPAVRPRAHLVKGLRRALVERAAAVAVPATRVNVQLRRR
jgi:hypothetical protein